MSFYLLTFLPSSITSYSSTSIAHNHNTIILILTLHSPCLAYLDYLDYLDYLAYLDYFDYLDYLQGLLLDFRVWGHGNLTTKLYVLEVVHELCSRTQDQLFLCLGLQVRLYHYGPIMDQEEYYVCI